MPEQMESVSCSKRRRAMLFIIAVCLSFAFGLNIGLGKGPHLFSTWMCTLPVQCEGNPWATHARSMDGSPSLWGESRAFEAMITDYYAAQGINILNADLLPGGSWFSNKVQLCFACSCANGQILYVLVANTDVDEMRKHNFVEIGTRLTKLKAWETCPTQDYVENFDW